MRMAQMFGRHYMAWREGPRCEGGRLQGSHANCGAVGAGRG